MSRIARRDFVAGSLAAGGLALFPELLPSVARASDVLKIGVILPASGVYAQLGDEIAKGMRLYFDQVHNKAAGREIQVISENESSDPSVAVTKATKLIESDKVDLLAGIVATPSAYAIRDLVNSTQTILVVANAGGNALTRDRKSPYIFRTSFTAWQFGFPLGKWVADHLTKSVYIIAADYAYGHESVNGFKESYAAAGGKVIDELYPPLGSPDFSSYIAKISAARPEVLFGFLAGSDGVIFLNQFKQYGLVGSVKLAVIGDMVEENTLSQVGDAALGARSTLHWALLMNNQANKDFVKGYTIKYATDPSVYSMRGFDTARVIVDAVNKLGGDTSDKKKFVAALESVKFDSPRGRFEFDPVTHNVVQDVYLREAIQTATGVHNRVVADLGRFRDPG
jgi:branched-chain amino acid transport system substrate-binding protein